jgi:PAS domain S-box-containing protein
MLFISMTHYHAESGAIYLRSSDSWVLRQHIGVTKKFVSDFERIPLEHPIVRDAMRASISFTNREEMDAAASSTASVPLTYMERAVGVMILITRGGRFEEEDRHMLSIVGAQAGSAIINSISRRQTQEELRSLESLVKYSADAIITYSLDGMVEDWNPAAQALYGYTEVEASGRYLLIVPEDQLGEMRDITARVAKGDLVSGIETVRVRKDGSLVQVSATYSPLKDPQGKIVGFSSISRDISNRRSAQRRETAPISEDWLRRMREMMADMLPLALQHRMPEEHRSAFILMLDQKLDDAFYAHYFSEDGHIDLIDFGEGMTRLLNDFGGEFEPLVNDSSLTLIGRRCPWNNENLRRPINCHLTKGVCAQFAMHALGNVTINVTESLANSDGCCNILIRKLT